MSRAEYRPIADYALIGNTHTAALVASDGSIDWCCLPHFDSGAVFCRILDARKGGFFRLGPAGEFHATRRYRDRSAVLVSEFTAAGGRVRLTDLLNTQRLATSRLGVDETSSHQLLRLVEGLAGEVAVELVWKPTFNFARISPDLALVPGGAQARGGSELLRLRTSSDFRLEAHGAQVAGRRVIRAGERCWVVLAHHDGASSTPREEDPDSQLGETLHHWEEWDRLCHYQGPYDEEVRLSARVLKLLTCEPTGGLVAAPTTSLPEQVGGGRNWDYRFCWLRDSALVLEALVGLGYHETAHDFFDWLDRSCRDDQELQIMYRLDGGRSLPEIELTHLEGYRRSAPVRVGNAAAEQKQLDGYGYVLDAAALCYQRLRPIPGELWHVLRRFANQAATRWREPDQGIWESRGAPRHFLSSKLLCWVALDRAITLARAAGLDADLADWQRERTEIRKAILQHGYDHSVGAFTQAFGSTTLDASALLIPKLGLLPASDPRMRSTIARIGERLTSGGLLYRYLAEDGVTGGEATFAICTYWLVDNLALQGRVPEARALFERVSARANDLGLLAEEIHPATGELLGNFPQGYTHLALIKAALTIERAETQRR